MNPIMYLLALPISIIIQISLLVSGKMNAPRLIFYAIIFMVLLGLLIFLLLNNIIGLPDMIILAIAVLFLLGPIFINRLFEINVNQGLLIGYYALNLLILPVGFLISIINKK